MSFMDQFSDFFTTGSSLRSNQARRWLMASALLASGLGSASAVTLVGLGSTNEAIPSGHGSTADVTLAWDDGWDQYAAWDGRGDVYQIDLAVAIITFTPSNPLVRVKIESFDLDEWAGGGDTEAIWSVTGSAGTTANGVWNTFNTANDPNNTGGRSLVSPMIEGLPGETVTLSFDHTGRGSISYLAMDNLTFSTRTVPEPSTALLGLGALGAAAMRRRRKS